MRARWSVCSSVLGIIFRLLHFAKQIKNVISLQCWLIYIKLWVSDITSYKFIGHDHVFCSLLQLYFYYFLKTIFSVLASAAHILKTIFSYSWYELCDSRSVVSDSLDPMDCSLPGPLCPWNSPGMNTGVDCLLWMCCFSSSTSWLLWS